MKAHLQSFWFGKPLSPYENLCLKSFIDHGHSFSLYAYDEFDVPSGVVLIDAATILPREQVFFYEKGPGAGSVAAFANRFRYKLLYELGGWWTDMDMLCLSADFPEQESFFAYQDADRINNGFLRFPARHKVMESCFSRSSTSGKNLAWGTTGPNLLTLVLQEMNMTQYASSPSVCYPLEWPEYLHFFDPDLRKVVEERTCSSISVHLWNEMIRRIGLNKQKAPPVESYLDALCRKHEISFDAGRMRAFEIHCLQQFIRIRGGFKRRIDREQSWF